MKVFFTEFLRKFRINFYKLTNFLNQFDKFLELVNWIWARLTKNICFFPSQFQNKDMLDTDDYNIPHWLNLSFYTTNKKLGYSNFVPRLRLPVSPSTKDNVRLMKSQSERIHPGCETGSLNQLFDYDAYDAQVFTLPTQVQR